MQRIPLTGDRGTGRFTLVDDADLPIVTEHRWYLHETTRAGRNNGPYAQASIWVNGANRTVLMHCLIMGQTGIDHADGEGLNNQRANLRVATRSQNGGNAAKYTRNNLGGQPASQYKGVCWQKRKPPRKGGWVAKIADGQGRQRHLGMHPSEEAAARAYDAAALELWGDFARLNFSRQ